MSAAAFAARKRSVAALELGRPADAVRFAKEAVAAAPDDADSFCVLANAQNVAGAHEEALQAAERACALDPEMEWAHAIRAVALLNLGKHRPALDAIDEAIRLEPSMAERYRVRARILAKLGRTKEAAQEAARACELAPEDAFSHDLVADLAFEARRYAEAESAWRAALRIDPSSAVRINNFGAALDRQGRKEEAREAYRRAIRMDPSLELSKRNLHQSVQSSLKVGALVAGGGAIGVLKVCGTGAFKLAAVNGAVQAAAHAGGANDHDTLVFVAIVAVIALALWFGRRAWLAEQARRRAVELEARDPDLMRLYRQIDADIAAGRIRKK